MFETNHQLYYAARAVHATELGDRATDPKIAALHYELALRYSILAVRSPPRQADSQLLGEDGRESQPMSWRSITRVGDGLRLTA